MNCEECKNLINELQDFSEARNDRPLAAHLDACKDCQKAYKFAEKLQQGFALIADEAPPPSLARRILEIQSENAASSTEQWSLMGWLRQCFMSFSFKMAVTLWLVTLLSGGLLLRYIDFGGAKMQQGFEIAEKPTTEKIVEQPEKKQMQIALLPAPASVTEPSKVTMTEQDISDVRIADAPSGAGISLSEEIPGATSFALDSEAESSKSNIAMFSKAEFADEAQIAVTREAPAAPTASYDKARLARAPEMSGMRAKRFMAEEARTPVDITDPRAAEILELLLKHQIKLVEGFVDLEELAMRGYIGSERLRALQPPSGNSWFLLIEDGQKKIIIKKK